MKAQDACFECFQKQIANTHKLLESQNSPTEKSDDFGLEAFFDKNITPPQIAAQIYEEIREKSQIYDIYKEIKQGSINRAKEYAKRVLNIIDEAEDKLFTASKAAVLGNVIDYGIAHGFDLESEFRKIFETPFGVDDFEVFKSKLKNAKNVVYLGDNAGENVFDELFIKTIKETHNDIKIYYFVRSRPIINDITASDLLECDIHKLCEIVDSGSNAPAFILQKATPQAIELFLGADLIISKGMGNYEALTELLDERIFFFFKVKCEVVASHIGKPLGSIILAQNKKPL